MRNKRLAAGSHLLPLHVSGVWSYGFRHYPHGPYPSEYNASYFVGEGMSQIHSESPCTAQMCFKIFRRSLSPTGLSLAPNSVAQPVLAAAGLCPLQPRLSATGDCGARIGDFKSLVNMTPPSSVPKYGGSRFILPLFHKYTKYRRNDR